MRSALCHCNRVNGVKGDAEFDAAGHGRSGSATTSIWHRLNDRRGIMAATKTQTKTKTTKRTAKASPRLSDEEVSEVLELIKRPRRSS
jgi:hypothetical protein